MIPPSFCVIILDDCDAGVRAPVGGSSTEGFLPSVIDIDIELVADNDIPPKGSAVIFVACPILRNACNL